MSSQIGTSRVYDWMDDGRRESTDPSPRDRVAKLLRDPKGYFADARRWAGSKARDDVQEELSERQARRAARRSPLLRILGFSS